MNKSMIIFIVLLVSMISLSGCFTPPPPPVAVCGDGVVNGGEQCDDGQGNGAGCTPPYGDSCEFCSADCEPVTVQGEYCGDGTCNGPETSTTCSQDCPPVNTAKLSRSMNAQVTRGSTFTVTLTRTLQASETTFFAEETVPSQFTITNAGTGTVSGQTIRWSALTGASSGTYTYTVRAPSTAGTYTFAGMYAINGGSTVQTSGTTGVTVQ